MKIRNYLTIGELKAGMIILAILTLLVWSALWKKESKAIELSNTWWSVQSVDTMKFSRDLAREKINDPSFESTIEFQVRGIAEMGATHVAVGTPYDEEFLPYLAKWVHYARKYRLNVWFRGNFSGWEGWFGYAPITEAEHQEKLVNFIRTNPSLFEDGDIFTTCPECENGGPGDPRTTGKVKEFRDFLINEYEASQKEFNALGKDIETNYFSFNGDVATLVMDKSTTDTLGNRIVIDHYVASPEELIADIRTYAAKSEGRVVLGEIGAPIPDIHGEFTEEMQAEWIQEMLTKLAKETSVEGLNYWVFSGGSTGIWRDDGTPKKASEVITSFYKPRQVKIRVVDGYGNGVENARVEVGSRVFASAMNGNTELLLVPGIDEVLVSANGYKSYTISVIDIEKSATLNLTPERETLLFRIYSFIRSLVGK